MDFRWCFDSWFGKVADSFRMGFRRALSWDCDYGFGWVLDGVMVGCDL